MSMEENNNATPLGEQTTFVAPSSNVRLKTDVAWRYVNELQYEHGRKSYFCIFCQKTFHGGGINRMKQHLAGVKGNVCACPKVPVDVKVLMQGNLEENNLKANEKHVCSSGIHINLDEDEEVQTKITKTSKRKASSNLQSFFKRGINDISQPSIKSSMQSKEISHATNMALALWFYDTYAKQSVHLIVESYRKNWSETGCTIMSDGWRDTRHRPLINFLVYCSKGISFIKSVDASDIESNAETLCNLFSEIVEIVGPKNVVHMVTDNAANYKAAGKLLCEKYPSVFWSPCVVHCINLIMKDIRELSHVDSLITLASRIIVFIYNHKWPLNWLRKRHGWTEIIRPGVTRFEELLGLPLKRELEFGIEVMSTLALVSIAPYRIAPIELKELKAQIQELLKKGFI
ncbi:uncharacterized protein LOC120154889 [Hibiscus syriacus]|uniref:uncharacterized protein LOC120154889 n=1 Tax=Hibiscus syriacus TaxID=106335 RepID=UPI001922FC08|nr:uncharacterized protein LOC120154889 [Hibiscus syriacus]